MEATLSHFDSLSAAWHGLWQKLAPRCDHRECRHAHTLWRRLRRKKTGVLIRGAWCCQDECVARVLTDELGRTRPTLRQPAVSHRLPLGLLLLSRQQLTAEQLSTALEAQRSAGRGRIGEWLQTLGFVSEYQITAALARQCSCPVLRVDSLKPPSPSAPQIPATLLQSFVMVPIDYVASTRTLYMAFAERIDYTALYAIEQMLECHTEACLAAPSTLRNSLADLAERRGESEIVLDLADAGEFARIVQSYSVRVAASEIRIAACGEHLWVRLLRPAHHALDLVLRSSLPPAAIPAL